MSIPGWHAHHGKYIVTEDILPEITVKLNVKYDCAVIYNKDLGSYNSYTNDGKHYNYLMVTYNFDSSDMYVIEYRK